MAPLYLKITVSAFKTGGAARRHPPARHREVASEVRPDGGRRRETEGGLAVEARAPVGGAKAPRGGWAAQSS